MGYNTNYSLRVLALDGRTPADESFAELRKSAKKFAELTDEDLESLKPTYLARLRDATKAVAQVRVEAWEAIDYGEEQKWYEHEEDMKAVSIAFPQFIFELDGAGEDHRDGSQFRKWFHRGRMDGGGVKIVWPEMNLKKLLNPNKENTDG